MKKLLLFVSLLLIDLFMVTAQSNQENANWVVNNSILLTSTTAIYNTPGITSNATSSYACVSDDCGNLLFTTDGKDVWRFINGAFTKVNNGFTLLGTDLSVSQNVIIVPNPANKNSFYIFTAGTGGLRSTTYNINYDSNSNDLGSFTNVNYQIFNGACTALTSSLNIGSNNSSYPYSIFFYSSGSNLFKNYLIGASGIILNTNFPTFGSIQNSRVKTIKVAPNGNFFSYSTVSGHLVSNKISTLTSSNANTQYSLIGSSLNGIEYSSDSNNIFYSKTNTVYKSTINQSTGSLQNYSNTAYTNSSYTFGGLQRHVLGFIYGVVINTNLILKISNPNSFSTPEISLFSSGSSVTKISFPQLVPRKGGVPYIKKTPTFNAIASICAGSTLSALPTTSTNGITGTWSPAVNNTATTTYTFTPSAGQCANTTTKTIVVNQKITPTFDNIAYLSGAMPEELLELPNYSNNGISGTWDKNVIEHGDHTYIFTPNAGQCAEIATRNIMFLPPKYIEANDDDFSATRIPYGNGITPSVFENDLMFNGEVVSAGSVITSIVSIIWKHPTTNYLNIDYTSQSPLEIFADGTISKAYNDGGNYRPGIFTIRYKISSTFCPNNYSIATATIVVDNPRSTARKAPTNSNDSTESLTDNIAFYPNPSKGVFNIDLTSVNQSYNSITVYNILGAKVYESRLNTKSVNQIDLSHVANGYYTARLSSAENSKTIKLIRN